MENNTNNQNFILPITVQIDGKRPACFFVVYESNSNFSHHLLKYSIQFLEDVIFIINVFFSTRCIRPSGVQGSKFDPVSVSGINRVRILNRFRFRVLTVF